MKKINHCLLLLNVKNNFFVYYLIIFFKSTVIRKITGIIEDITYATAIPTTCNVSPIINTDKRKLERYKIQ